MTRKIWFDWKKKRNNKIRIRELNETNTKRKTTYKICGPEENRDKNNKLEHMVQTEVSKLNPVPRG